MKNLFKQFKHKFKKFEYLFRIETFTLLIAFAFLTSCSDFLNGKPKADEYIEVNAASMDCLNNVSEDLKSLLNANADVSVIDKSVICINNTLTELQNKVEGREDANAFTADEVYDIFTTFVDSTSLSRQAALNLIEFKAALLGGEPTRITKKEITDLKNYLLLVKEEAKKLVPYIKIYQMKNTEKEFSKSLIAEAFTQLNVSVKVLLNASQIANSNYSFSNFKTMIINVLNLADKEANMVDVMTQINYVLNGYQEELSDLERKMYIDSLTEFLKLYSYHVNSYVKFEFDNLTELDITVDYIKELLNLVENSLQYRKTYLVSVNSLDHLMLAVAKCNLFKYPVRASSLINFYKTLFVRVFESGLNGNIYNFTGVKPINLINLKREIAIYQLYSRLIKKTITDEMIQAGQSSLNIKELQIKMANLTISAERDILDPFDANTQYLIVTVVKEMRDQFINANPLIYYKKKMGLAYNEVDWSQSQLDLTRGLWVQFLARVILLGYGSNYQVMGQAQNELTPVAMYLWYGELKAIGIDTKSLDPRTFNAGTSFLKIANLFTRKGNGDEILTYNELTENLAILISGGPLFKEIDIDMDLARCRLIEKDVYDEFWNTESCFEQVLQTNYAKYFAHMPHLLNYLNTLSPAQFKDYFHSLINVARTELNNENIRVESADIKLMGSLLYYIEILFMNHDLDRNWKLSESEIRTAYPKFKAVATEFAYSDSKKQIEDFNSWKATVAGLGCFSEEELIEESFIFLAYKGRTPTLSDFNSFPCFTGDALIDFSGEVERRQISDVFQSLKTILAP